MSRDVTPNFKDKRDCGCGDEPCTACARPLGNDAGCVRGCTCNRHRNGANRKKGDKSQRKVARMLGVKLFSLGGGNEEHWRAVFRTEVKDDQQAQAVGTFHRRTWVQSGQSKAVGDTRPFVPIAVAEGIPYAVFPLKDMDKVAFAWLEAIDEP